MRFDQSNRCPDVHQPHVMVLPQGWWPIFTAQPDENLPAPRTLDVDVRWVVLSRRRVYVPLEAALVEHLHNGSKI